MTLADLARRAKGAARLLVTGRAEAGFEDEAVAYLLAGTMLPVGAPAGRPRLNVIAQSLSNRAAFGGTSTLIELPMQVYKAVLQQRGWDIRFVCAQSRPDEGDNVVEKLAQRHAVAAGDYSIVYSDRGTTPIAVSADDVFLGSLWNTYYVAKDLLAFQRDTFGSHDEAYVSFVQDYEASFHPWSSAFMMARALYEKTRIATIFNSNELFDYYRASGHPVFDHVAFDPVMNSKLADLATAGGLPPKQKRILVYARPIDRRNCYAILKQALAIWSEHYPRARDWTVVAVGSSDARLDLASRVRCELLGKLTLEGYATELARAGVGVSLMASPHPSYPPLEMAHFGAITITNSFLCKNLTKWHSGIRSLDSLTPHDLAQAITNACEEFSGPSGETRAGRSLKPDYLRGYPTSLLTELADLFCRTHARSRGSAPD